MVIRSPNSYQGAKKQLVKALHGTLYPAEDPEPGEEEEDNHKYIAEVKKRWDDFVAKVQFYGVSKKAMKPPMTLDGVNAFNSHCSAILDYVAPMVTRSSLAVNTSPWLTEDTRILKRHCRKVERLWKTTNLQVADVRSSITPPPLPPPYLFSEAGHAE
ncbi:hypothetical protein NQZ68_009352 [Dissostichus eleginoides]|nr:hypothetical protein NQZ68_009352 [Dissostichus eleginoides]